MNSIPVIRNGAIIIYDRTFADLSWSYEELLEASSFYATCIESMSNQTAYTLSYIFIMTKKHPDMFFEKTHIHMIDLLLKKVNY